MQSQKLVLIPPSDEQASPSFHVVGSLLDPFLEHLAAHRIEIWQPPEPLGPLGPRETSLFEIEIKEEHSMDDLDRVLSDFLEVHGITSKEPQRR
jgi:hypothetical protein